MKNTSAVLAAVLCLAAAGANAQSFEQQLSHFSRTASAAALRSRQTFTPLAQMTAVQGRTEWKTMAGADGTFFAELPGTHSHTRQSAKTANGDAYTMDTYMVESARRAFVIQTAVFPSSVDASNPRNNLQAGLDNAAKNMEGGRFISVTWTTHQGLLAVDAVGIRGGYETRTFSMMRGQQIFSMTYAGTQGTSRSDDANRFFASLRIR